MFTPSFRARLIAWYICLAGVIALALVALAAVVLFFMYTQSERQLLANAARQVQSLVVARNLTQTQAKHLQDTLNRRFESVGIAVRARVFPPPPVPGAQGPSGPPPRDTMYFSDRKTQLSPLAGIIVFNVRPEHVRLPNGDVLLFIDPRTLNAPLARFTGVAALFVAIVLFAAWRIADIVALHVLAPLLRTTRALNRFGEGDFTPESVDTNDRSELGQLAHAYNGAVAQITYAFNELWKNEAEMRQFVADAGHQLRTPLTVIMGHLSGLASRETRPSESAAIGRMLDESRRMKALIDDLILLAKLEHEEAVKLKPLEVNALVARVAGSFAGLAGERLATIPAPEPVYVLGSESELFSAVAALVDNALKYSDGSTVTIAVRAQAQTVAVDVDDAGPGLSDADRSRVFDRFYRGETSEGILGTGLGLAIVRRSAERAEGSVTIENRAEGGLRCRITLPQVSNSSKTVSVASMA